MSTTVGPTQLQLLRDSLEMAAKDLSLSPPQKTQMALKARLFSVIASELDSRKDQLSTDDQDAYIEASNSLVKDVVGGLSFCLGFILAEEQPEMVEKIFEVFRSNTLEFSVRSREILTNLKDKISEMEREGKVVVQDHRGKVMSDTSIPGVERFLQNYAGYDKSKVN